MDISAKEETSDKNVLIIGGNGFLGCYIVRKFLKEGCNVTATYRKKPDPNLLESTGTKVRWLHLDIRDIFALEEAMEGIDIVVNTAAIVSFDPSRKKEALTIGLEGTANIVNAALVKGIKKFIHVSSVAALGRKKPENYINEKEVFSHSIYDTHYGLSKFLAEQEVWRAHFEGLPVAIISPSMVIGAGPWGQSSTSLFTSVYDGLKYYPQGVTGFVDVRDVADAVYLAATKKTDGERFIISAVNLSFEEVLKNISQNLNLNIRWKPLTPRLAAFAWRWSILASFFTGKPPVITSENVKSTSTKSWYDNTKSKETLGLNYREVNKAIEESAKIFLTSQGQFIMLD
jgi:dihydroflavonol-4-reductase